MYLWIVHYIYMWVSFFLKVYRQPFQFDAEGQWRDLFNVGLS